MQLDTSALEMPFDQLNDDFFTTDIAEALRVPFGYHSFVYFEHRLLRHIRLTIIDLMMQGPLELVEFMIFGNGKIW